MRKMLAILFISLIINITAHSKCDYEMNVDSKAMYKKNYTKEGVQYIDVLYLDKNNYLINGNICLHQKGILVGEFSSKDGKDHGVKKAYYNNGNIRLESTFEQGRQEGITKYFLENGNLDKELFFLQGRLVSARCPNGYEWTKTQIEKWNGSNEDRDSVRSICNRFR
ncbi:MAG: hypothetical protein C0602_05800 [Denitrovibrio sp.]|nr:MAG: hypothetical protein C0602_05800 [Denitrovibrio sp.]